MEPTPTVVGTQEREEPEAARSEATTDNPDLVREQDLPDFGSEQVLPDIGKEQVLAPGISPRQPEKQPEHQPEPLIREDVQSTPPEGEGHRREHNTCQQWLRWLREQVSGVADQLDEEQKRREHLMRTTTDELVKVRAQMQSMGEELTRAKESAASMAIRRQQSKVDTEPIVMTKQKETLEPELEPVREETLETGTESTQEIKTVREELAAQEALREKEREEKKLAEEERRRIKESL